MIKKSWIHQYQTILSYIQWSGRRIKTNYLEFFATAGRWVIWMTALWKQHCLAHMGICSEKHCIKLRNVSITSFNIMSILNIWVIYSLQKERFYCIICGLMITLNIHFVWKLRWYIVFSQVLTWLIYTVFPTVRASSSFIIKFCAMLKKVLASCPCVVCLDVMNESRVTTVS